MHGECKIYLNWGKKLVYEGEMKEGLAHGKGKFDDGNEKY